MSSQLPLSEAAAVPNGVKFAFASGLAVAGNTVVISYGAGDRDARALVMTLEKLDVSWNWISCGGFLKWRYQMDGLEGKILLKWMMTGGPLFMETPMSGDGDKDINLKGKFTNSNGDSYWGLIFTILI